MKTLVATPLYNELETLEKTLISIRNSFQGDILVINDGSDDGSGELLEKIDFVKSLHSKKNHGYGYSINLSFEYAIKNGYDIIVTCDLDDQHEPSLINSMIEELADNDILSGSRYSKESITEGETPEDRKQINMKITKIINQLTNFNLTDTFCGFKSYKVKSLEKLKLTENGYSQPLQLWIQSKVFNFKIKEKPIPRIYKNLNRSFGNDLDDNQARLNYYIETIRKEISKWEIFSSLEHILTMSN